MNFEIFCILGGPVAKQSSTVSAKSGGTDTSLLAFIFLAADS
jgi:hypothetical protein